MSPDDGVTVEPEAKFAGGPNSPVEEASEPVVENTEPAVFDAEYVKSLRAEAAQHRVAKQEQAKRTAELEARLKEFEDAQLTESERTRKEFEETRTKGEKDAAKVKELSLSLGIALAAREEKITDVKAAVKLADRGLIEYDSDGSVMNIQQVIENLRTEYPSVFNAQTSSAPNTGVTNPAKAPTSGKKYTREDMRKMTPERRVELLQAGEFNHLL